MNKSEFFETGWCLFDYDQQLANWISQALPFARQAIKADENNRWLRCGGTWMAGVNALPNRADGSVGTGSEIRAAVIDFIHASLALTTFHWDRAQVSVCYPGYPQPMDDEPEAAFVYRRDRDAAHVDGLLPEGPHRRRHLREYHGFILGIPMVEYSKEASPFVVWPGSHEIVRQYFMRAFEGLAVSEWGELDVTRIYHECRRAVFKSCERVEILARPGQAYLVHRLALHGIAPWQPGVDATEDGRMICYFRPETSGPEGWLLDP
jgi:hypothetical protein